MLHLLGHYELTPIDSIRASEFLGRDNLRAVRDAFGNIEEAEYELILPAEFSSSYKGKGISYSEMRSILKTLPELGAENEEQALVIDKQLACKWDVKIGPLEKEKAAVIAKIQRRKEAVRQAQIELEDVESQLHRYKALKTLEEEKGRLIPVSGTTDEQIEKVKAVKKIVNALYDNEVSVEKTINIVGQIKREILEQKPGCSSNQPPKKRLAVANGNSVGHESLVDFDGKLTLLCLGKYIFLLILISDNFIFIL